MMHVHWAVHAVFLADLILRVVTKEPLLPGHEVDGPDDNGLVGIHPAGPCSFFTRSFSQQGAP
jgi:hypothetical protein